MLLQYPLEDLYFSVIAPAPRRNAHFARNSLRINYIRNMTETKAKMEVPTIPATAQLSKKQVFFILRPDCTKQNDRVLKQFFSDARMQRCGIDPIQYRRIKTFTIDQTAQIKRELLQLWQ